MTETRESAGNLFGALAQLQSRLPKIGKGETANVRSDKGNYSYKYADLADVSQAVLPLLGAVGLAFTSRPTIQDGQFVLAYSLVHASGEREDGIYPLPSNGTPQAIGSAITYARRYCLCAVTGAAPDNDDDAAGAAETGARHQAGESWESAKPAPSRQNGNSGQRGQVSRPAVPTQAPAAGPEEVDEDAQEFANEAHGALTLGDVEDIHRRAREKGKLAASVRNPAAEGAGKPGKLAIYIEWKRKQLKDVTDALTDLSAAAADRNITDLEGYVKSVTGTELDAATAGQLRAAAGTLREKQPAAA